MQYHKRIQVIIFLLGSHWLGITQGLEDKQWLMLNYIHFDFQQNEMTMDILPHPSNDIRPSFYNNTICDEEGNLQFFSSGCFIANADWNVIMNGDSLDPGSLDFGYCQHGHALWDQNTIILPLPDHDNQYLLFSLDVKSPFPPEDTMYASLVPLHMYYHVVDMDRQNGSGEVILKRQIAVEDTLARGYIQATRHANGRDWWVSVPEWNSQCYYVLLVSPDEISLPTKWCSGPVYGDSDFGAAVSFSPDGAWYARTVSWLSDSLGQVDLFSFDRCSGELQHQYNLTFPIDQQDYTGLSFSPGSQFLYVSTYKSLWQYDLWSDDIPQSLVKVGVIDGNLSFDKGSLFAQRTGPDHRTYINSPLGHNYLSTIHFPDKKGVECQFMAHDLLLPEGRQNYRGLPNYPNYRLGPMDDSLCDTLHLDNIPVSNFRYEVVSNISREIRFINLSYHEPEYFYWDFGDTNSSDASNPIHVYDTSGVYTVCLIVENDYGSDIFCQDIELLTTSSYSTDRVDWLTIFPTLAKDMLFLQMGEEISFPIQIEIISLTGQRMLQQVITDYNSVIDLNNIPSGMYLLKAMDETHRFTYMFFVKI